MPTPAVQRRVMWYLVPVAAVTAVAMVLVAALGFLGRGDGSSSGDDGRSATASATPVATPPTSCPATAPVPSLRALATPCGISIGAAVNDVLFTDRTYRITAAGEYNSITPESALKWGTVEPRPGEFNFGPGDAFVAFAEENGQRVHGHTLVWHTLPAWVTEHRFSADELREVLRRHVQRTVAHWRGRIASWDVVNEPLGHDANLRDSVWLRSLGADYIADAFRWAREADPDATLFINDFDIEGINPKSDRLYELVRTLRERGVPIDGVGFQTHVARLTLPDSFEANLRRFADLGVRVAITELDVRVPLPATQQRLEIQASIYARVLRACLQLPACDAVTTWGLTDGHSWINREFPGQGAALPFDEAYRRKPAYWSLHDTLAAATSRPAR